MSTATVANAGLAADNNPWCFLLSDAKLTPRCFGSSELHSADPELPWLCPSFSTPGLYQPVQDQIREFYQFAFAAAVIGACVLPFTIASCASQRLFTYLR